MSVSGYFLGFTSFLYCCFFSVFVLVRNSANIFIVFNWMTDYEEDPDFVHSDVDTASEEDDLLYERNVTDDIEIGSDMNAVRNEGVLVDVGEVDDDDLHCPSCDELLLAYSSNEEVGYRFPEFLTEANVRNPQFEVGQLFRSMQEFRSAVRTYGALNGYNVKLRCNDRK